MVLPTTHNSSHMHPCSCQQGRRRYWFIRFAIALIIGLILANELKLLNGWGREDGSKVSKPALRYSEAVSVANGRQEKAQQAELLQNNPADTNQQSDASILIAENPANDNKPAALVDALQQSSDELQPETKSYQKVEPQIVGQVETPRKSEPVDNAQQSSVSPGALKEPEDDKATIHASSDKFEFISKLAYNFTSGEKIFYNTAHSFQPVTDKVTGGGDRHNYEVMYGQFLLPFYASKPKMKFLEIGLGCDMRYGPGASVAVWRKLFPDADLWEAEYNAECVEKAKENGMLDGFATLTGDQMDVGVLDNWIKESGGADFVSAMSVLQQFLFYMPLSL